MTGLVVLLPPRHLLIHDDDPSLRLVDILELADGIAESRKFTLG